MARSALSALLLTVILATPAGATTANDICSAAANPCIVSNTKLVTANSELNFGTRALVIANGGTLDSGTGQNIVIRAGSLTIEPRGRLKATAGDQGAGSVTVITSGNITIQTSAGGGDRGRIDASSVLGGGNIQLCTPSCAGRGQAGGNVTIDGDVWAHTPGASFGGIIEIIGRTFTQTSRGVIQAFSGGDGGGGSVSVTTYSDLVMNNLINVAGGQGGGGDILLDSGNNLTTAATSELRANARQGTNAGDGFLIELFALGHATLGGTIDGRGRGNLIDAGGSGADVDILVDGSVDLTAKIMADGGDPDGDGGDVDVDAGLSIMTSGLISSTTLGSNGFGGTVTFTTLGGVAVGPVDVSGGASGGDIIVDASGAVGFTAALKASGVAAVMPGGGAIEVFGCNITVQNTASLESLGMDGRNLLHASGLLTVSGPLTAGQSNMFEYRNPAQSPVINVPPVPSTVPVLNTSLPPCGAPPTTSTSTSTTSSTSTTVFGATTTSSSTTTTTGGGGTSTTTSTPGGSSTSTSQPGGTTTTTTVPAGGCNPAVADACNDSDPCTIDQCDAGTCVNDPRVLYDGVYCRIDAIDDLLAAASPDSVGGAKLQRKLQTKILKVRGKTQAAESANLTGSIPKERRGLKKAGKLLRALAARVQRGKDQGQIDGALADQILALADEGGQRLQGLTP